MRIGEIFIQCSKARKLGAGDDGQQQPNASRRQSNKPFPAQYAMEIILYTLQRIEVAM